MQRQHIIHKASSALNELINDIATDSVSCPGQNGYGSLDGKFEFGRKIHILYVNRLIQALLVDAPSSSVSSLRALFNQGYGRSQKRPGSRAFRNFSTRWPNIRVL